MRTLSISAILLSAVSLGACVSATSTPNFDDVEQSYVPLAKSAKEIAEGEGNTPYESIGSGTYSGLIYNSKSLVDGIACATCAFGGDGPAIEFIANLEISVNFGSQAVTGRLSDFFTPYAGFKSPDGTVILAGSIYKGAIDGLGYLVFSGEGQLVGSTYIADFELEPVEGAFGGASGQVMAGSFKSNFGWLDIEANGALAGFLSESDGLWVAMK